MFPIRRIDKFVVLYSFNGMLLDKKTKQTKKKLLIFTTVWMH